MRPARAAIVVVAMVIAIALVGGWVSRAPPVYYVEDVAVLRDGRFVATTLPFNAGYTRDVVWVRFSLRNDTDAPRPVVVDATREWVEHVDLYTSAEPPMLVSLSGARMPLARRPISTERIVFPVELAPRSVRTYRLRIQTTTPLSFGGEWLDRAAFDDVEARREVLYGGMYAVLLAIALCNVVLFIALRERGPLWLACTLAAYATAEMTSHGHLSRFWPSLSGLLEIRVGPLAFALFAVGFQGWTRATLPSRSRSRGAASALTWSHRLAPALCIVGGLVDGAHALAFVGLVMMLLGAGVAVLEAVRARHPTALAFAVAVAALAAPGTLTLLSLFGVLPAYDAIEYANHVGVLAMACLFSLVVAQGIRMERGQLSALNADLKRQIAERSRELASHLAAAAAPALHRLEVGAHFEKRYRIERLLGEGAMGVVYEVERISDARRLALKVVSKPESGETAARLAREAQIGAHMTHLNLVEVVDVGVAPSGAPYIVMELLPAGSLEDHREQFGDAAWALPLIVGIARGLEALHAANIIHRDIKPANVLLHVRDNILSPKIADFGLSRFFAGAAVDALSATVALEAPLTRSGALVGTPLYMAPEAAERSGAPDSTSDVFSFGVLAYEMLTAKVPFSAVPIIQRLTRRPIPAAQPMEIADRRLADIVHACIELDPTVRPSMREVRERLDRL